MSMSVLSVVVPRQQKTDVHGSVGEYFKDAFSEEVCLWTKFLLTFCWPLLVSGF